MSPLTLYLGRLIGLGMVFMCLALAARPRDSLETIARMTNQPGLLLVTGIFTMTAGLALVIGHNLWSGPPLVFAVTIIGWISFLKGLAILLLAPGRLAAFYRGINYPKRFAPLMWIGAAVGAWIAWMAFVATPQVLI